MAKQFSLLLVLIFSLFLSSDARESRSFSKSSRINKAVLDSEDTTSKYEQQQQQQQQDESTSPSFYLNNEKNYGLYGTGGPPATPSPPYRPSNYRTDSYVTVAAEDTTLAEGEVKSSDSYTKTYHNKDAYTSTVQVPSPLYRPPNYNSVAYVTGVAKDSTTFETEEEEIDSSQGKSYTKTPSTTTYKTYQNSQQHQYSNPTTTATFYSQPQGMSDTRTFQKGKYHFDLNTMKYNKDHPYSYYENYRNTDNTNRYDHQYYQEEDQSQLDEGMP